MPSKESLILDGYIRVSRVGKRKGPSFISPDEQRAVIEGWAERNKAKIAEWHTDLDQSGGKMDRPGFNKALARIDNGKTGGIVVAKLDRFARSNVGALKTIERIEDAGGVLVSVQEGIEPGTQTQIVRDVLLSLANFELDRYRNGWAAARASMVERGIHHGNQAPFGYDRSEGEDKLLVPNRHADLVERAFKMRATDSSWKEIADFLNEHAKPNKGEQWTPRTVQHLVRNRVYLGIAYSGDFENTEAHPALVSRKLFDAAQRRTVTRKPRSSNPEDFPLVGIVRCAGCGHRMKPDRYGPSNNRTAIYRCRVNHGSGKCPKPSTITAKRLNEFVLAHFFERIADLTVTASKGDSDYDAATVKLSRAEDALSAYLADDELRSLVSRDAYLSGADERQKAVDSAREALEACKREASGIDLPADVGNWSGFTVHEQRKLLGAGLDAVFIKPGRPGKTDQVSTRATIAWRGEADNLPGSGVRL